MIVSHRLSLEEAQIAVDAALDEAARLGVGSVVCVSDAAGYPIALKRPDNGKVTSVDIAINKAFTAACHRRPTHTYTNAQPNQEAFGIMNMHGGRFAIFVGGWPIEVRGEVVGGIGVSGGHTKEDIACCKAGITALLEHLGEPVDFSKWDQWQPPAPTAE
ncbi:MAG TPA: heme-binding protein [Acidimicrobiales bacterium]